MNDKSANMVLVRSSGIVSIRSVVSLSMLIQSLTIQTNGMRQFLPGAADKEQPSIIYSPKILIVITQHTLANKIYFQMLKMALSVTRR